MQFNTPTQKIDEETTAELFAKCVDLVEFVENMQLNDENFKDHSDEDRALIVASPLFTALFEQLKHRYRANMTPATTVLMVATIVRNFANSDGFSEVGLASAVDDFVKMMNETAGNA